MLQTSTGSINQFLQSKSTRNNFSHTINYINSDFVEEHYFNESIFNKNRKISSPKIELIQDDRLKALYNNSKNNNIIKNITYVNKQGNKVNRSSDKYQRIILTKRCMKQITGKTLDFSHEHNYDNYNYNKTENNEIRRAKSGYYEIQKKKLNIVNLIIEEDQKIS